MFPSPPYFRDNISAMLGYVPGEQPQAGKFIKLNTNENPYPSSSAVTTAVQNAIAGGLQKYPDPVADVFRLRAADLFEVPKDGILCGNGSDDLLTIITRALVSEGQRLRMPYPSYVLYKTLAEIQGAIADVVHFEPDWTLPVEFTDAASDPRLAVLANPNSPSGTCLPPEVVAEIAERLPCPLLVDEAYGDFADTNCLRLVEQNEKIMVSRSLSKSYAMAGLRFGFLVAQPQMIDQFMKVKDSYNCDAISIAAATAAIDDQDWLADNQQRIRSTRQRMIPPLEKMGFSVQTSQANFVWCTHSERPVQPIYEQLKSQRILVRYMNYEGWGDGLRITVGSDEQVDVCLDAMGRIIEP